MSFSMQRRCAYIESDKALHGKSLAMTDYSSFKSLNLYKICELSFYIHY